MEPTQSPQEIENPRNAAECYMLHDICECGDCSTCYGPHPHEVTS